MSDALEMSINERRKYLHKMKLRYWKVKRKKDKGQLLDEMEAITGLHRKSLIRLINGGLSRKSRRRERGKIYGPEVDDAVRVIARSLDYPCAERLQPNLVWMAKHLTKHGEMGIDAQTLKKLERVSVSTLQRILKRIGRSSPRIAHRKAPRKMTRRMTKGIPMRRIAWDEPQPGHFEVDLVHHCGESASGQYVHTIQMLDVATGWSECMAVLGRSYLVMQDGFTCMLARLPIELLEIHPDNGSEFFSGHLLRFWKDKAQGIEITRSRPYQKNDNRFVEENNYSQVRAYVGYSRLDTVVQTMMLNQLFDKLWLYHNVFQPVMRLNEKIALPEQPYRYARIYGEAKTPFDRLCATGVLAPQTKQQLQALREDTNPCRLRDTIDQLIDQLFALPGAKDDVTEDVHLTVGQWKHVIPELDARLTSLVI